MPKSKYFDYPTYKDFPFRCDHICSNCGPWNHSSDTEDCDLGLETEARCPTCIEDDEPTDEMREQENG
jgi:hypothetical protein